VNPVLKLSDFHSPTNVPAILRFAVSQVVILRQRNPALALDSQLCICGLSQMAAKLVRAVKGHGVSHARTMITPRRTP
jgi:hypothetical protein